MDYTRCVVSTINGGIRVMTGEMRQLLKNGIQRKLVPLKGFNKPLLKLDAASKEEIKVLNQDLKRLKRTLSKLEYKKAQVGLTQAQISEFERQIELTLFDIFECQSKIRDVKVKCYKGQTSILNVEG